MLVETSAWVAFYKNNFPDIAQYVQDWLYADYPVSTTPLIMQEVLQGFQKDKVYKEAYNSFITFNFFSLADQKKAAIDAANIYRTCRKIGFTIRNPNDCMIALVALTYDLPLLHNDKDFDHIAKVVPLKLIKI